LQQLLEILKLLSHIEETSQQDKWTQATDALRLIIFFQGKLETQIINRTFKIIYSLLSRNKAYHSNHHLSRRFYPDNNNYGNNNARSRHNSTSATSASLSTFHVLFYAAIKEPSHDS
jgi:hypothetical protein